MVREESNLNILGYTNFKWFDLVLDVGVTNVRMQPLEQGSTGLTGVEYLLIVDERLREELFHGISSRIRYVTGLKLEDCLLKIPARDFLSHLYPGKLVGVLPK
jgi:hypothetical protein